MLDTGRRSAISTSELGLYSERVDRLSRSRYGLVARKFAVGVMVVVGVILVAIFLYDFSSASTNSRVNQETKHIYILQNALRKSTNFSRKFNATSPSEGNVTRSDLLPIQDRSDIENYVRATDETLQRSDDLESRAQNLNNFQLRKRVLKSISEDMENGHPEGKQIFDNHAVVYRVRQRHKYPDEELSSEESRPTPFHWEYRTPHPASFKRAKYPQLSQYRYPHNSRNIQDIIKYLTNDPETPSRGIKFAGVYMNPKKYDFIPDMGDLTSNSDRSEDDNRRPFELPLSDDPFYQYKPKHPSDVNLLATSNVRFSPSGLHRYNPFYDPYYARPVLNFNKPSVEPQFDNSGNFVPSNLPVKRKPKPFSVMLDIYPITDIVDQNKKASLVRPPIVPEDYELRRPTQYNRVPKFYGSPMQPIPAVGIPNQQSHSDDDERQQMIFHLNLYPRKKNNKLTRQDIIHKSESIPAEDRREFMEKIMSPLEAIAKHITDHSTIEEYKFDGDENVPGPTSLPITRYQESELTNENERNVSMHEGKLSLNSEGMKNAQENYTTVLSNHRLAVEDDYASTEKYEHDAHKPVEATTKWDVEDYETTVISNDLKINLTESRISELPKDIDTIEGFHEFNDSLLAME